MGLSLTRNICSNKLNPFRVQGVQGKSFLSTGFTCGYSSLTTLWFSVHIKWMLLFLLLTIGSPSFSQNAYTFFKSYTPFEANSKGKFSVEIDNMNFFKNNEYYGRVVVGYTLPGTWIRPKALYYPDDKLRLELGGNVLKYNGRDEYFNLRPWFSVHYQPLKNLSFIMGNLDNDQNHKLIEPLADPERYLTAKPEAGFQVKYKDRVLDADCWIDWQQFILTGDPFSEHIAFGLMTNWTVLNSLNDKISLPYFMTASHTGGEIDTVHQVPRTFLTLTSGFCYNHNIKGGIFNSFGANCYISLNTHPGRDTIFIHKSGLGTYLTAYLSSRYGTLTAAYWHGHDFYAPQGGNFYQSLSIIGNGLISDIEVLNLKYHFDKEIFSRTYFGFMFDFYYDTLNRVASNIEGIYLAVNFGIPIKKKEIRP